MSPNVHSFISNELLKQNINVNVHLLRHPIDNDCNIPKFSYDNFVNNNNQTIIQIGQQLRKMTSIYLLKTPLNKLWLTGTSNFSKLYKTFNNEKYYLNIDCIDINDVKMKYTDTFEEYDDYLCKNIVFIDLFDTAANNVVLECIIRTTPLLISRLPGAIYYLGEDYPMFFNNLEEVPSLITNENILKTHNYLKTVKTTSMQNFIKVLVNIIHNTSDK